MKKLVLCLSILMVSITSFSQDKVNLVVFSDDGDKFYLVINGVRQNMKSETNVKITDLTTESFSFKIIFEDTKIEALSKTQYLPFGNEYTFRIKTDKKGKRAMKPFGQTELSEPSTNTGSTTVAYHTTEIVPVETTTAVISSSTTGNGTGVSTTVGVGGNTTESKSTTTTTSTTTTSSGTGNSGATGVGINMDVKDNSAGTNENVSVGVNAGGIGMNIDINVNDNGAGVNTGISGTDLGTNSGVSTNGTSTSTYSSTTTTTTTTSSSGTGNGGTEYTAIGVGGSGMMPSTTPTTGTSTYTGTSNYACGAAMKTTDFEEAKKSIESKDFEDSKLTVAKQVAKSNCLSSAQVKEVIEIFDFEDSKLQFAKFAYDYCYDKNNYYKLNDAFDFESSVDELNQYIEKK